MFSCLLTSNFMYQTLLIKFRKILYMIYENYVLNLALIYPPLYVYVNIDEVQSPATPCLSSGVPVF